MERKTITEGERSHWKKTRKLRRKSQDQKEEKGLFEEESPENDERELGQ